MESFYWKTKHSFLKFVQGSPKETQELTEFIKELGTCEIVYDENELKIKCTKIVDINVFGDWKEILASRLEKFFQYYTTTVIPIANEHSKAKSFCGKSEGCFTNLKKSSLFITGLQDAVQQKSAMICNMLGIELDSETEFNWEPNNKCLLLLFNTSTILIDHLNILKKEMKLFGKISLEKNAKGLLEFTVEKGPDYAKANWKADAISKLLEYFAKFSSTAIHNLSEEKFNRNKRFIEDDLKLHGSAIIFWSKKANKPIVCGYTEEVNDAQERIQKMKFDEQNRLQQHAILHNQQPKRGRNQMQGQASNYKRNDGLYSSPHGNLRNSSYPHDSNFSQSYPSSSSCSSEQNTFHPSKYPHPNQTRPKSGLNNLKRNSDPKDMHNPISPQHYPHNSISPFSSPPHHFNYDNQQHGHPNPLLSPQNSYPHAYQITPHQQNPKSEKRQRNKSNRNKNKNSESQNQMKDESRPRTNPCSKNGKDRQAKPHKEFPTFTYSNMPKSLMSFFHKKPKHGNKLKEQMLLSTDTPGDLEINEDKSFKVTATKDMPYRKFKDDVIKQIKELTKNYSSEKVPCSSDLFQKAKSYFTLDSDDYCITHASQSVFICGEKNAVTKNLNVVKEYIETKVEYDFYIDPNFVACTKKYIEKFDFCKDVTISDKGSLDGIRIEGIKVHVLQARLKLDSLCKESVIFDVFGAYYLLLSDLDLLDKKAEKFGCAITFHEYKTNKEFKNSLDKSIMVQSNRVSNVSSSAVLMVKKGDLLDQSCECMVRSTANSFGFGGIVSKAMLKKGGQGILQSCQSNFTNGLVNNNIIITDGGNLSCKKIFHVALVHSIEKTMKNILTEAQSNGIHDLCMPLIGTGGHGGDFIESITSIKKAMDLWTSGSCHNLSVTIVLFTDVTDDQLQSAKSIIGVKNGIQSTQSQSLIQSEGSDVFCRSYGVNGATVLFVSDNESKISKMKDEVKGIIKQIKVSSMALTDYDLTDHHLKNIAEIGDKHKVHMSLSSNATLETTGDIKVLSATEHEILTYLKISNARKIETGFPSNWEQMNGEPAKRVILVLSTPEFNEVACFFKSKFAATIVKIERIQNEKLYGVYEAHKKVVAKKNKGIEVVKRLFHGTTEDSIAKIMMNGFDKAFAGKNGTSFGHGVYFSTQVQYSNKFTSMSNTGERKMIIADVITGRYCQGSSSLKTPPYLPNSNEQYNSVVNNESNPTIFVVFRDWDVYPTYIVTYKY